MQKPLKPDQIFAFNNNIVEDIKIELVAQGHELTGATINSIKGQVSLENGTIILEAYGSKVIAILDKGVAAQRTGWKQFPFLVDYFRKRGYADKEAKGFAAATIQKWAKEGMSTQASKRFSETGDRQGAVEKVFEENKDHYDKGLGEAVDITLEEVFNEQQSEVI
jgi:outer membrane cobalamin receptor